MGKPTLFDINLFGDINSVYFAGSKVEGNVVLELSEPYRAQSISIVLSGKAHVYWLANTGTRNPTGESPVKQDTQHFFDDITKNLWGNENESVELATGRHEFPFSFQLPWAAILPTSFESKTGHIRYSLLARIQRSWKFEHTTTRAIVVNEVIDINTPRLRKSLSGSTDKTLHCLLCTSGPVSLTAKTDRGGYCPGESIAISVEAENHTNRKMSIRATLKQKVVFQTALGYSKREKIKIIKRIEGPGIGRHATTNWDNEMLLIPPTVPSITTCRCIKVSYMLTVTIGITGARDLHVTIPLKIGNIPLQDEETEAASTDICSTHTD